MATVAAKREGLGSAPAKDSDTCKQLCHSGLERHSGVHQQHLSNAHSA
jgi:hypothetical protein